jgi:glutamate-1-semialdehyde aminotransferase
MLYATLRTEGNEMTAAQDKQTAYAGWRLYDAEKLTTASLRQQLAEALDELEVSRNVSNGNVEAKFSAWNQLAEMDRKLDAAQQALRNVYEVWAGSEGVPVPRTAFAAHLLSLVEQMRDAAKEGLQKPLP